MRIAVVGGGAAGIVSAYLLQKDHEVVLFEKNDYLGGHTHTITIPEGPDAGTPVDTGFIVLNDRTYPLLRAFLKRLNVKTRDTGMSFAFHSRKSGLFYSGSGLNGFFAQRRNIFRPAHWAMLREIGRFSFHGEKDLREDTVGNDTLGEYLGRNGYSRNLIENYVIPMCSAIWSSPFERIEGFPAAPLLRFFHNHGLLSLRDRPQWMTVVGGSRSYVEAFLKGFTGVVNLAAPIEGITRGPSEVTIRTASGENFSFDRVVIAAHADEALRMLTDPTDDERRLLGPWQYQPNETVLHTDTSILAPSRRVWSSWNYTREEGDDARAPVSVTYYMNRLQGFQTQADYCVTLNGLRPISESSRIAAMTYHHPLYSFESMATQKELPLLNGRKNTFFCGSYFGYGFHEDAVRSAAAVGQAFGSRL
ncbi:MAG: FAD-dependent oxidoreductase [Proteobacteria bacterium]|nr:FAD-dependent oxidoreductase [Pseudomonadota bacterium]